VVHLEPELRQQLPANARQEVGAAERALRGEPVDDPDESPVYEDIVHLQSEQFLRFRSWLGRRAMLWPDRIDVDLID
jgi:hypothetical protein